MSPDTAVRGRGTLGELRTLRRAGLAEPQAALRVRELLHDIDDALDLEAAGGLLSGTRQREQLAAAGGFHPQRVAILGSSTLDPLPNLLTASLVRDGMLPEVRLAGFDQWRFEIMSGAPNLKDLDPRIVACLLDDAVIFSEVTDRIDVAQVEARCAALPAELRRWTESAQQVLGGLVVLCTIPLGPLRRERLVDYRSRARLDAAWSRMNAEILDLAAALPSTVVLSASAIAAHASATFAADRMRHAAGHAFAPEFLRAYAGELAGVARADLGRTRKCLVLDLDNTLWGGVVGDDGVAALRLGGAYPGSAYQELQALARDLMSQGVMLAVCSKNDDAVAREAIATHPGMVLGPDSFVAVSANWDPKPGNVAELARRLNIGVDAMVFVDDNPVERGLMRRMRPEVETVELPSDPAGYAAALAARGDFTKLSLTDEDRGRTSMYQAQERRAELERETASLEDYLLELDLRLSVEALDPLNTGRIVQLFGKTNQFNLTGRRYAEDEVTRRRADGSAAFFGARLSDRFGDNGLIAALAVTRDDDGAWRIENMVLSCRAFSRNVEDAVVGLVLRAAHARGAPAVTAAFVETAKNAKFAGFYTGLGFTGIEGSSPPAFRHELRHLAELPRWIDVTNGEVLHAF